MAVNNKFEAVDDVTGDTSAPVVITFSSNVPTPGLAQTIGDGAAPTGPETGQAIQNLNDALTKAIADIAALQAAANS